jgi:hypothetical protein
MSDLRRFVPMLFLAVAPALGDPTPARAQGTDAVRGSALRVFLDCDGQGCDDDRFRTDIDWVSWVRDRTLAQVHLIITSNQTGGGGNQYTLDFIGLEGLDGDNDQLPLTTLGTDTQDEIVTALTRVIAAGLARYSAAIGEPIGLVAGDPDEGGGGDDDDDPDTDEIVTGAEVQDPWNFWVFEIGGEMDLEGEEFENQRSFNAQFEASRTTDIWKFQLDAFGNANRNERELDDGRINVDERTNWSVDFLLARTLAPNWSAAVIAGAGASSRLNQDFGADMAVGLEYSFFPYEEAPRRSLTARYDLRMQHYDWEEETIYNETAETRPQHAFQVGLFQQQPWGETFVSVDLSQFLHDANKWRVGLNGELEFRITRGLNLDLQGGVGWIEDQIFISREGLTDEEILLGQYERPTDSTYELQVGLSFEFGSIFNNVVNNRFDSRGFGFGGGGDGGGGGGGDFD